MTLERLFDKCPVLPVDVSISVARYLRSIRQTIHQANESESGGDLERAALLHIRVLQLICKTLPAHPEYGLAENRSVLEDLREIAHVSFSDIERLDILLGGESEAQRTSRLEQPPRRCVGSHHVEISANLVELFEKIGAENTAKGFMTIGVLAGRVELERSSETSARKEREDPPRTSRISALVIPSQIALSEGSTIRYEADVTDLLRKKGLVHMGFIQLCPKQRRLAFSPTFARMLAPLQRMQSEALGIVLAPQTPSRVAAFSLTEDFGLDYVLACVEKDITVADEVIPQGEAGEGNLIWIPVRDLEIRKDAEPTFKLYDLRPLAAARDGHERSARRIAAN